MAMETVEILSALRHCTSDLGCDTCPMRAGIEQRAFCVATLLKESKTAIIDLLAGIDAAKRRCAQAQAERDALREKVPRWISVEDRLPEVWKNEENDVLVNYMIYAPEFGADIGNYHAEAKRWLCMAIPCTVTHWMPLPEAPEGGGKA
jgi:hypothetical protein